MLEVALIQISLQLLFTLNPETTIMFMQGFPKT
jgi:hypothetical protein